jgi:AAA15 family ATPase/GTPase
MSGAVFKSFHVKRYRSLMDVKIDISDSSPVVICGENNIGKTNFIRALNVYFNHLFQADMFSPDVDIPYHIYDGSRGGGTKTEMTGSFVLGGKAVVLKVSFDNDGKISYLIGGKSADLDQVKTVLSGFNYMFIESNNVNLPALISKILEKDGLLQLDTKRKNQTQPLEKLREFIELSQKAISGIEKDINQCFEQLTDFDGILKGKKIKIAFAEFDKLRDVVKTMTSITLFDGNSHGIASKGSGAQRALFLALMQYISQNSKRKIIWGIDEPEVFLQPRLQKKVADVLSDIVQNKKQPIILTTHSQHFIKLSNLSSTYIFKGTQEPRTYKRKPGRIYYEMDAAPIITNSDFEKATLIKQHLGISNNDGWEVLPYNILVEGEEDKKYLETLFAILDIPSPSIIWSGGASKIGGYLQYYNIFSKDLNYRPKFVCIFDHDDEGREQEKKIKPKSYSHIDVKIVPLPRHDGKFPSDVTNADWEIEDFLPPDQMMSVINYVLKKEGYRQISKSQILHRGKSAHIKKQLLKYAEECCNQNNSAKEPLELDNEGRKKQICQRYCEVYYNSDPSIISAEQANFLKSLIL